MSLLLSRFASVIVASTLPIGSLPRLRRRAFCVFLPVMSNLYFAVKLAVLISLTSITSPNLKFLVLIVPCMVRR